MARFASQLLDQLRAVPGLREAAVGNAIPLQSGPITQFVVSDRARPSQGDEPWSLVRVISPAYFRTLGIRRTAGREFTDRDVDGAPRVAIINAQFARKIFPGEDPVGHDILVSSGSHTRWLTAGTMRIVGVVSNVKDVGMNEVEFNNLYLPFAQSPEDSIQVVVDSALPTDSVVTSVRAAAAGIDPDLPVIGVSAVPQIVDHALNGDRFNMFLIGAFAVIALLLSAIGIYGAMAYAIEQRTQEFGVRLALGASRRTILISALSQSARFGIVGTTIGLGVALVLARVLGNALYLVPQQHEGLLYGVSTTDPLSLASASAVLVVVAALSGLVPARRATGIDPLVALRCE
jgi:predicted permease